MLWSISSCGSGTQGEVNKESTAPGHEKPIYQLNWIGIQDDQQVSLGKHDPFKFTLHNLGAPTNTDDLVMKLTNTKNFTFKLGQQEGSNISATLTAILKHF